jgi:hypothetical protein
MHPHLSSQQLEQIAAKSADLRRRLACAKMPWVNTAACNCAPTWPCVALLDQDGELWQVPAVANQCNNCRTPTPDTTQLHLPCAHGDKLHDVAIYVCTPCADRLRQCTIAAAPPFTPKTPFERFCVMRGDASTKSLLPPDAKRCSSPACNASEQSRLARFQRCARCRAAWYCCQTCQRVDWSTHRDACIDVVQVAAHVAAI